MKNPFVKTKKSKKPTKKTPDKQGENRVKKTLSSSCWKPGQSGNPNGRPKKGQAITDIMDERVDKHAVIEKICIRADEGYFPAQKYICDRLDGVPTQHIEMKNEGPMIVNIIAPKPEEEKEKPDGSDTKLSGKQ